MFKHWFPCLLPVFLALDLLLPFLFAIPYRGYSHLTQVMSVLGNPKAPLHILYDLWLVALGAAILCSAPRLYALVAKASPAIGAALLFVLAAYAVGGCILSGIFPVGEGKTLETLAAKIHGYGSVIGFLLLTFAPLLAGLYFFKASNGALGGLFAGLFCVGARLFHAVHHGRQAPVSGNGGRAGRAVAAPDAPQYVSSGCGALPFAGIEADGSHARAVSL